MKKGKNKNLKHVSIFTFKILNRANENRNFFFSEGLKAFMFNKQTKVQSQFQESALRLILNNCFLCILCAKNEKENHEK